MKQYALLEIGFTALAEGSYNLNFRLVLPNDAKETHFDSLTLALDLQALAGTGASGYPQALSRAFFSPDILATFRKAKQAAQLQSDGLRVRLAIDAKSQELHQVHWETLIDPDFPDTPAQPAPPLFMGEKSLVSRFLNSGYNLKQLDLHRESKANLRALVAIANPSTLPACGLVPIDRERELEVVRAAMTGKIDAVPMPSPTGTILLNDLEAELRTGYDILYLLCHGQIRKNGFPYLYLDDANGGESTSGLDLVERMSALDTPPKLVMLVSCQSAGREAAALSALGPRLIQAGVPAVVAMQGNILVTTAEAFMRSFFPALMNGDGQIDLAMSVARGDVRNAPDYWSPVLFMSLSEGRLWYDAGFGPDGSAGGSDFAAWDAICDAVCSRRFTPVLGPELGQEFYGGTAELALSLASQYGFPLASHERSDLAKVMQFVSLKVDYPGARAALEKQMANHLKQWAQTQIQAQTPAAAGANSPSPTPSPTPSPIDLAVRRCSTDPANPYFILNSLGAPIYINASYDKLLYRMIKADGSKAPELLHTRWAGAGTSRQAAPKTALIPTPARPWIYHIFGTFKADPAFPDASPVFTEDDFFDYLIASSKGNLFPDTLEGRITESSLLFLGFRLDDWRFRVLFRRILSIDGRENFNLPVKTHVGVQLNPNDQAVTDVYQARRYMEKYFLTPQWGGPAVSIYWGSSSEFLAELKRQLQARAGATQAAGETASGGDADGET